MKSKILLQLQNRVVYVALLILSLRLIEVNLVYVIPFLFILYFVIKRVPSLLIYVGCILIFLLLSVSVLSFSLNTSHQLFVKGDIKLGDITSFTAVQNGKYFRMYTDSDVELSPGDRIRISGEEERVINQTIPHTFNYKNYLLSKRIKTTIFIDEIEVTGHRFSFQIIREKVSEYIDRNAPLSGHYIKTFILADQSGFEEDIKADIKVLGVSHLFAVSGLHIGLLALILDKGIKKLFPTITPQIIIIPILFIYILTTSFSPSVIRASLLYVGLYLNKYFKLEFSTLDILSFIFVGYIIVSPYAIYSLGFSLSFLVTFSIILGSYLLKDKSNPLQLLIISVLALGISLPITTSLNYEINLLTILVNTVLIYGMSFVILPLGYITFFLPFFDGLYSILIGLYEKLIFLFSRIDLFRVNFAFISHVQVLVYYVLLVLVLSNIGKQNLQKYVFSMGLFLVLSMNIQILNPIQSVSMIDVYGDSIFIKDSFDRCNILVDTGVPDDYDSVVQYLKGLGIKRIDYFIVTHEDNDHKGEREDIHNNFKVIKEINSQSVLSDKVTCGTLQLSFYEFYKTYSSKNNQSVVFQLEISNTTYLFTGDMESQKEQEFLKLYDIDVDILKSGHHGSITSSTEEFLENIQAEEVWISCYRRNTHNHPHEVIVERYEVRNMDIYRTDTMGTIEQYYIFKYGYKKFHKP